MGQSRLQTFDELLTFEMSPESTFVVWNVDDRGNLVSSSMNVVVHSHEKARVRNGHFGLCPFRPLLISASTVPTVVKIY